MPPNSWQGGQERAAHQNFGPPPMQRPQRNGPPHAHGNARYNNNNNGGFTGEWGPNSFPQNNFGPHQRFTRRNWQSWDSWTPQDFFSFFMTAMQQQQRCCGCGGWSSAPHGTRSRKQVNRPWFPQPEVSPNTPNYNRYLNRKSELTAAFKEKKWVGIPEAKVRFVEHVGDLLEAPQETKVHAVASDGWMSRGLAKSVTDRIGKPPGYEPLSADIGDVIKQDTEEFGTVWHLVTKVNSPDKYYKDPEPFITNVERAFPKLAAEVKAAGLTEVAMSYLCSGMDRLHRPWIMEQLQIAFKDTSVTIHFYNMRETGWSGLADIFNPPTTPQVTMTPTPTPPAPPTSAPETTTPKTKQTFAQVSMQNSTPPSTPNFRVPPPLLPTVTVEPTPGPSGVNTRSATLAHEDFRNNTGEESLQRPAHPNHQQLNNDWKTAKNKRGNGRGRGGGRGRGKEPF
jgi:hypothetical protein